jgi:hypothetical protein
MATGWCYPSLHARPAQPPLGRHLASVSRTVSRAFDEVLAEAGDALFLRLRDAATAFDRRLRAA